MKCLWSLILKNGCLLSGSSAHFQVYFLLYITFAYVFICRLNLARGKFYSLIYGILACSVNQNNW